jgi:cobalt-zinc-cadmium efflux system outer membrane protein
LPESSLSLWLFRVADDALELASEVKLAFYSLQASEQLLKQFKLIADTDAASLDLAQRQYEIGNISDLALARQQAAYSHSRMDIATTEAQIRRNREKLNRLLELWGPVTDWRIAGELSEVPASDLPMSGLERLAISQRLDLQAAYLELASQAKNLGLTKSFRLVGALDFGGEIERETDTQIRSGPTFVIELPIFNQGQARIARGEPWCRRETSLKLWQSTFAPRYESCGMSSQARETSRVSIVTSFCPISTGY